MKLALCDVKLVSVKEEDIELLRMWRNHKKIVQFMFFNENITKEMQAKWFASLKETDFYFIIEVENKKVGLINLSDYDDSMNSAYAGLFIFDESYWGTPIPVLASLALLKFAFEERKLDKVFAKIQADNTVAKNYNSQLGFQELNSELLVLEKEAYNEQVMKLITIAQKYHT